MGGGPLSWFCTSELPCASSARPPCPSRSATVSSHFREAATSRGLWPSASRASRLAPRSRRAWTQASSPLPAAACSGVEPSSLRTSTGAPQSSSQRASRWCPLAAAQCSAVWPTPGPLQVRRAGLSRSIEAMPKASPDLAHSIHRLPMALSTGAALRPVRWSALTGGGRSPAASLSSGAARDPAAGALPPAWCRCRPWPRAALRRFPGACALVRDAEGGPRPRSEGAPFPRPASPDEDGFRRGGPRRSDCSTSGGISSGLTL
mmetsp:Transcript_20277/g.48284  ORF Transcript_20277/g.48284 Transcript_20277/m.48284 type:complete len:262 (-) Transcript_20277:819-1604(-)